MWGAWVRCGGSGCRGRVGGSRLGGGSGGAGVRGGGGGPGGVTLILKFDILIKLDTLIKGEIEKPKLSLL